MRPILHAHLTSQPPPSPPGTIDPDPNSARRRALPLAGQGVCCCCTVPVSSWTRTLMPAVSETREGGGGREGEAEAGPGPGAGGAGSLKSETTSSASACSLLRPSSPAASDAIFSRSYRSGALYSSDPVKGYAANAPPASLHCAIARSNSSGEMSTNVFCNPSACRTNL
eukprot:2699010-Rhodomonas_salina.1